MTTERYLTPTPEANVYHPSRCCYALIDGWWRMVSSTATNPNSEGRGTAFWIVNYTCGRLEDSGVQAVVLVPGPRGTMEIHVEEETD